MSKRIYVFDHFLFTTRRGTAPTPWFWEIRRKSKPGDRSVSAGGFRSAKAAEEAGRIVLAEVREAALRERRQKMLDERQERLSQLARKELEIAEARASWAERRSKAARIAARARAKALSPERRSEIANMGGAASKAKAQLKRKGPRPRMH